MIFIFPEVPMQKQISSLFLAVALLLPLAVHAQTSVKPAGLGTGASPWQIATLSNLYWLSQTPTAWADSFTQTSDIDASTTSSWSSDSGFKPIGNMSTVFSGSYNGKGHVIYGLTINRPTEMAVGFFGVCSGKVDSLALSGATVIGGIATGIAVGYLAEGTLSHSYTTGSVEGSNATGGLAGYFQGTINQSYSLADVTGSNATGGLIGAAISGTLSYSYFAGTLSRDKQANGLVANAAAITVSASFWDSTGQALSSDNHARSTQQLQAQSTFTDSAWDFSSTWLINANMNRGFPYLKGVALSKVTTQSTQNVLQTAATVTAFSSWSTVTSRGFCWNTTGSPTLADYKIIAGASLSESEFSANISGLTKNITYYIRAYAISGTDTVYGNILVFTTPKLEGAGTPSNPYLVSSYGDLRMVGVGAHSLSASYRLTNDIDASSSTSDNGGAGMFPIGSDTKSFTGNFHGAGYAISNMQMNWQGNSYVGLFGYALNSLIDSLGLKNITVKGFETVGALAGYCSGCKIFASHVTGGAIYRTADGANEINVGGLVGLGNYDTIKESSFAGTITVSGNVNSFVGGLLGYAEATVVRNSYAEATATLTNLGSMEPYLGGLIGRGQNILIDQSHSNSSLSNTGSLYAYSGGLVGWVYDAATISTSYASGSVNAVVTDGSSFSAYAGGLVGTAKNLSIDNSFTQNSVNAYNSVASVNNPVIYSGGLVGYHQNGHINNSYSTGSISASALTVGSGSHVNATIYEGGLVGYGDGDSISLSYGVNAFNHTISASGTASSNIGGILGKGSSSVVTKSFWNNSRASGITGCGSGSCGASSLDSTSMVQSSSFPTFDFASAWIQYNGHTFPLLRGFMTPLTITANDSTRTYDATIFIGGNGVHYSSTPNNALLAGTLTYGGTSQGAKGVGNYIISVNGLYSSQLGYAIQYLTGTLLINPKSVAFTGLSIADKVYDGTTAATLTGTATLAPNSILTGESVSLSTGSATAFFVDKNVGTAKKVLVTGYALSGANAANYTIDSLGFTAAITAKELSIASVTAADKVYDGNTTATLSSGTLDAIAGDNVTLVAGSGSFSDANVGNAKPITASGYSIAGNDASNYTLGAQPPGLAANITPYPITVTADAKTITQGDSNVTLTYTATPLLTTDTWAGALARIAGDTAGTYAITQGTLDAGLNYAITLNGADYVIHARPIEVALLPTRTTSQGFFITHQSGDVLDVTYNTSFAGNVNVDIYSLRGQKMLSVNCGVQNAGAYFASIQTSLPVGIYTATLRVNGFAMSTIKLVKTGK